MADDKEPLQTPYDGSRRRRSSLVPEDAIAIQFDGSKRRNSPAARRRGSQAFLMGDDTIVMTFADGNKRRLSSFCTTSSNE